MTEQSTALIVLDPEIVAVTKRDQAIWLVNQWSGKRDELIDKYALLEVVDDATKVAAERAFMDIRSVTNAQDEERRDWGRPFDLAKKAMDAVYREAVAVPELALSAGIQAKINAYVDGVHKAEAAKEAERQRQEAEANRILREQQAAAEAKAKAEAEATGRAFVPPPVVGIPEVNIPKEPPKPIAKAAGMKYRRWWLYEVTDLKLVPDAYTKRVLDEQAVKTAIAAATTKKGDAPSECSASIPGIRIYHEDKPA